MNIIGVLQIYFGYFFNIKLASYEGDIDAQLPRAHNRVTFYKDDVL